MVSQPISLLLLALFSSFSRISAEPPNRLGPVQEFVRRKCGDDDRAIWYYEGHLVDPLDGSKISSVQGLELVDRIGINTEDPGKFNRQCQELQVGKLVDTQESTSGVTGNQIGSMLSSKAFCYTQDNKTLLRAYHPSRKGAPQRKVPLEEALTRTDSVVSLIEAPNKSCLLHTELLQTGSSALGSVIMSKGESSSLELKVFAMPKDLTPELLQAHTLRDERPRRSKLIQFGSSPVNKKSRGAREVYRFTKDGRVRYTRYGEGPVWYGIGRMCQLELVGQRLQPNTPLPDTLMSQLSDDLRLRIQNQQKHTMEEEDPVFRYYCDALQTDEHKLLGSCAAYKSYYADQAMQRTIRDFRQASKRSKKSWLERLRSATSFGSASDNN